MISYGGLLAIFTVFLWSLGTCLLSLSIHFLNVHPIACIMMVYIWAGLSLLGVSVLGKTREHASMKDILSIPATWTYGMAELSVGLFTMLALTLVSPAEASFLSRVSVIFAMLIGLSFFGKHPSRLDWQCFVFMLLGVLIVLWGVESSQLPLAFTYICLGAISLVARGLSVEHHPTFKLAGNIRERCKVTGTIVLISGIVVCSTLVSLAYIRDLIPFLQSPLKGLPSIHDFMHPATVIFAMIHGALVIALTRYTYFRSVSLISNTTFLMFAACAPFLTYFLQELLNLLGLLGEIPPLNSYLITGGIILTLTSLWAAFGREVQKTEDLIQRTVKDSTKRAQHNIDEDRKFIDAINRVEQTDA